MTWFVDNPDAVQAVIAGSRSRAVGAGVDPFQYEDVTSGLDSLRDWLPAFAAAGYGHAQAAEAAESQGKTVTAAAAWRAAAVCWHIATTLPHPDLTAAQHAGQQASRALRRHVQLSGGAIEFASSAPKASCVGELRLPVNSGRAQPPVVLILPGLDSSRVEFLDLADALLARGLAVVAVDGPGQGALAHEAPTPDYQHVATVVLDQLDTFNAVDLTRVGVIGLSLGGLYALLTAVHEPRVTVAVTVSGTHPFPAWDSLPPFATDTLRLRAGSASAAEHCADRLHHVDVADQVTQPLLVVSGSADILPTPSDAEALAAAAPRAQLALVAGGDHLCGNVRWRWLDATSDWLAERLHAGSADS